MKLSVRFPAVTLICIFCVTTVASDIEWVRKSTETNDMPVPNDGDQQTCCVVADLNKDGADDFVIGERTKAPSVVWYSFNGNGWDRYIIEDARLRPEAGGDAADIDGDGDKDVIFGQDASGNSIWWWENPYPDFSKPWKRRSIKNSGANKHHDQTFGDYDGDAGTEFVSWNQRAKSLLLYEIPGKPRATEPWEATVLYSWTSGREREGFPSLPTDLNLDGKPDIIGGGRWFEHQGGTQYIEHVIDAEMAFTQCAAGQLIKGGRPEVVFSPGDMDGDAKWYRRENEEWQGHKLRYVRHGHTCEIRDVDGDSNMDIMIGEMGDPGAGDEAKVYIWYGDGKGGFREDVVCEGQGIHEGRFGDFDGDGDLDILVKPYHHNSPRIDILLNNGTVKSVVDGWEILFDGGDLDKWRLAGGGDPSRKWAIEGGTLARRPKAGMIWTKQRFDDFILDLEFKTEGNSGVFFRTNDPGNPVQTGFEMQVNKPSPKPHKNSSGSIYDALAPAREMTKAGQWNHVIITADDNSITIVMNGEKIIDMDVNRWDTAGRNPDESKNKFRTALKDFERDGHIGFQDHGANVWYRNVKIKHLP